MSPPWRLRFQLIVLKCAGSTPLQGPGSMHHQQEGQPTLVLQPVNLGSADKPPVLGSNPCSSSNSRQHPSWRRGSRVCGQPSCAGDVTHVTAAGGKTHLGAAACGSALCRQSYRTGDPAGHHAHESAAECCHCYLLSFGPRSVRQGCLGSKALLQGPGPSRGLNDQLPSGSWRAPGWSRGRPGTARWRLSTPA